MKNILIYPAIAAMLICAMPSCSNDDPANPSGGNYTPVNNEAISKALVCAKVMPENTKPSHTKFNNWEEYEAANEQMRTRRQKVRDFSWKFAETVGSNTDKNIVVSPMSAFMVLGMAAESANGQTQEEIYNTLGLSPEELKYMSALLCNELNRNLYPDHTYDWETGQEVQITPKNLIKSINTLWTCDKVHFNQDGLAKISKDFYCDLFSADFGSGEGNKLINAYVKNETRGFLDVNLDVDPETVLAIMNVLYMKEVWNDNSRDLDETKNKYDFANSDQSKVSKKLLEAYYQDGRAIKCDNYRKFFARTNDGFTLTFIVPEDGNTASGIYKHDAMSNNQYTYSEQEGNVVTRYHTRCLFPEFNADMLASVKEAIETMGVRSLFVDGGCDFSNLVESVDGYPGIYCGDVKQAARLEVTRSGIEGAAVTIMEMAGESCPGPDKVIYKDVYEDFIVDRAFAYTLEDPYGNVLFTGVVNKIE